MSPLLGPATVGFGGRVYAALGTRLPDPGEYVPRTSKSIAALTTRSSSMASSRDPAAWISRSVQLRRLRSPSKWIATIASSLRSATRRDGAFC